MYRCKMYGFVAGLTALALLVGAAPVKAGDPGSPAGPDPFVINFDENGNASVSSNGGPFVSEKGTMMADQSGLGLGNVLTYALPELVTGGGVNILDANGQISDNLFFYTSGNTSFVEFLSQTGGGALADTGVGNFGFTGATEVGDQFSYNVGNVYNGTSSTVPEPASLTLLGLGAVGLAGYGWRRRKVAMAV